MKRTSLSFFLFLFVSFCFGSSHASAFLEEQVQFEAAGPIKLTGYLTRPLGAGPFPALILQLGHGEGTTDSKNRSYNPFAQLARELAGQGFVVLRFDKRGTGYNKTNGSYADASLTHFVQDLDSALLFVEKHPRVLKSEIFLLGHSLGGPVVSMLAGRTPKIRGLVLIASPGRSFVDFNSEQLRFLYEFGLNKSGAELEKELAREKRASELVGTPQVFCAEFPEYCERKGEKFYLWGQTSDFWKEIARLDPVGLLKAYSGRVAVIQGTSDWVISSEHDGLPLKEALPKNSKGSFFEVQGLDHFLLQMPDKKASVRNFVSGIKDPQAQIHPELIPLIQSVLKSWR